MSVYGFDQMKNHVWKVLTEQLLYACAKKDGVSVWKCSGNGFYNEDGFYFAEKLAFGNTGLVIRKESVCQSLIWDSEEMTFYHFVPEDAFETSVEVREIGSYKNYYFFVNLDSRNESQREKINGLKEELGRANEQGYSIEIWDICIWEQILKEFPEILPGYSSYLISSENRESLFPETQNQTLCRIERYLEKCFMEDRFSKMEQAGSVTDEKVALQKVFVDLEASPADEEADWAAELFVSSILRQGNSVNRFRGGYLRSPVQRQNYLLLGTAGQGKSTVCQYLVQLYRAVYLERVTSYGVRKEIADFLKEYQEEKKMDIQCLRIPVHIVIKEYAAWMQKRVRQEETADILSYIGAQIGRKASECPDMGELRELLRRFSWVFVFDGLDEVPLSSNRGQLILEIQEFMRGELFRINCDCMIICTSRPQGNLEGLGRESFCYVRLEELSEGQCMAYLRRLTGQMSGSDTERENALAVLQESVKDPIVSRLMKSPLQATIVAILVKTGGKPPRDRYNLFETYYTTIKNREKQKETLETLHDTFEWIDRIHYRLALQLQRESESDDNPSASIDRERLLAVIRGYLEEVEDGEDAAGQERRSQSFFRILTERLCFITDVNTEGEYMFSIRSMQEFLAANGIVRQREKKVLQELERIAPSAYWRNVFLFAIGYLNKNVQELELEIRRICENLNGAECTPAQCSLEKISCAGSRLALDILVEGIYKGASRTEKAYYDIFFQMKSRVVTEGLKECRRLPKAKKKYFSTEYILPQLETEKENLTLWYMLTLMRGTVYVLGFLHQAALSDEGKAVILQYLSDFFTLWIGPTRERMAQFVAELMEAHVWEKRLSYDECCRLLIYGGLDTKPAARKMVYENLLLKGVSRTNDSERYKNALLYLPGFWDRMENILRRLQTTQKDFEVGDVVIFHLRYSVLNGEEELVLQEAALWFEQEQMPIEASFLRFVQRTDREHMETYFRNLWEKETSERLEWLAVHAKQFYALYWMYRKCNLKEMVQKSLEEIWPLFDEEHEQTCRTLNKAMEEEDWAAFWKVSNVMGANGSGRKNGICNYMEETGRCCGDIGSMGEEELAHLIFVAAVSLEKYRFSPEEEQIIPVVYEEYRKRKWSVYWINIWARKLALYLLRKKSPAELFQDHDDYRAFTQTEWDPYLYKGKSITRKSMQNLWEQIVWMAEMVGAEHPIFRVVPAILLLSPKVELNFSNGKYRQLLGQTGKEPLGELGRLLFLMLVPDWSKEEAGVLAKQIFAYLDEKSLQECGLFLKTGEIYDGRRSCIDGIWIQMYEWLMSIGADRTKEGRACLERLGELGYGKVMGEET